MSTAVMDAAQRLDVEIERATQKVNEANLLLAHQIHALNIARGKKSPERATIARRVADAANDLAMALDSLEMTESWRECL